MVCAAIMPREQHYANYTCDTLLGLKAQQLLQVSVPLQRHAQLRNLAPLASWRAWC
jgi:hypothetical protein